MLIDIPMTRTSRLALALMLGYGFQFTVALVGLVLTPFLLGRLGAHDYGLWLVVAQVLGLLGLLDLGVNAILGREVAAASGGAEPAAAVADVARRAAWLVWLQTPVVAIIAVAVWGPVSARRPELAAPLGLILGAFVLLFPTRLFASDPDWPAGHGGRHRAQSTGWAVTTAVTVGLVLAGAGLYALVIAWIAGQAIAATARGLPRAHPRPVPASVGLVPDGRASRRSLGRYLGPSGWASVVQLAHRPAQHDRLDHPRRPARPAGGRGLLVHGQARGGA